MKALAVPPAVLVSVTLALAGCGGGGGGGGGGDKSVSSPVSANTDSCGLASGAVSGSDNVLPVTVTSCGLVTTGNMPYVDVTICAPGSSTDCKTIGYVLVDTASYGLRVFSSALGTTPTLPKKTDGSGRPLSECVAFVSGYMWGNVRLADVKLGGLTASSLPIQIVADTEAPVVPSTCSDYGADMGSVRRLGANGILGIGTFAEDLGDYYTCTGSTCSLQLVSASDSVSNPVAALLSDNNGVILDMPSVSATGAATVSGSLTFGIGTRGNNTLGSATVFGLDLQGNLRTIYGGNTLSAFIDSGSNGLFFDDATITECTSGWFCPAATISRTATLQAATAGTQAAVSFDIANANALFATGNAAFNNLGAPWGSVPSQFDWGMPFFYGRRVYFGIYGNTISGNPGPFVAY
jgi:hypothetical protein